MGSFSTPRNFAAKFQQLEEKTPKTASLHSPEKKIQKGLKADRGKRERCGFPGFVFNMGCASLNHTV